jgi:hypothetical protein
MKRSQPGPNFGIGFVFVLLLCLANQLCAKCPTDSVEVRGKVECCLKPDDKVLVTLLFSGQQEASGEETAIDIHNGAFSGRVAFNTYSSSFLGGDRCHRHPESVLLRLIEANGMEKDRTSLKIASDFNYDEKQGEYTPKLDTILRGWCQQQCDGTSDWHKVDAGPFSILDPSGWEFHQLQGVDSYVGEFVGDGAVLTFDFGEYSNPLKEEKKPAYVVVHNSIGGFSAKIVSPRMPGHGVTGVYFKNVGHSSGLCLWGKDLTSAQQELVLMIFATIRFGGAVPRYVIPPPPPAPKNTQ